MLSRMRCIRDGRVRNGGDAKSGGNIPYAAQVCSAKPITLGSEIIPREMIIVRNPEALFPTTLQISKRRDQ